MIVMLFLAILAGYGAAALVRAGRWTRGGLALLGVFFLAEAPSAPIPLNGVSPVSDLKTPSPALLINSKVPPVYSFVSTLPAEAVIAEFPFGHNDYELRYMFYSTAHWRPLLNGYSGGSPQRYAFRRAVLGRIRDNPDLAWEVLTSAGATHAIVHEGAYHDNEGVDVSLWLRRHGAREVGAFGGDRVFQLR